MAFNRDRNNNDRSGGDRGGFRSRPSFGDRPRFGDRGPVEMHQAICDNCGKQCEVPFRPTSGKPIFCSSCFDQKKGGFDSRRTEGRSEGRNFERSERSDDRPMFNAVCANCGNDCKVPFKPTNERPVYCSNCFEDRDKNTGNAGNKNSQSPSISAEKFDELNIKLDAILKLLGAKTEGKKETKQEEKLEETKEVEKPVKKTKKVKAAKAEESTPVAE